jgi:lysyl endopeptidase
MIISTLKSQVEVRGKFIPLGFSKISFPENAIIKLPPVDNEVLLNQVQEMERPDPLTHLRPSIPVKFGQTIGASLDIKNPNHGQWIENKIDQKRTWRAMIKSPGARSISVLFSEFYLPENAEFYVIGTTSRLGAFTAEINNKKTRKFATTPIAGDTVILEYIEPIGNQSPRGAPSIKVDRVVHGFRSTPFAYRSSGTCNIDISCRKNEKNVIYQESFIVY